MNTQNIDFSPADEMMNDIRDSKAQKLAEFKIPPSLTFISKLPLYNT